MLGLHLPPLTHGLKRMNKVQCKYHPPCVATCTHIHTLTCTQTCSHTRTHTHACTHTHMHAYTHHTHAQASKSHQLSRQLPETREKHEKCACMCTCVCMHVQVHETEYTCERECLRERREWRYKSFVMFDIQDKASMESLKATISLVLVRGMSLKNTSAWSSFWFIHYPRQMYTSWCCHRWKLTGVCLLRKLSGKYSVRGS